METIIFIHGAWHGKWCWDKHFKKEFSKNGYNVITFDLPGHSKPGKAFGINKYSIKDYVNSLKIEVQKLKEDPIIIGHSMGGLILQKFLEKNRCKKAIFMASVPPNGILKTIFKFARRWYFYTSLLRMDLYRIVDTEKKSKEAFFSDNISNKELKEYSSLLCSESIKAFINMLIPRVSITKNSQIPILVIAAKNDFIFSIKDNKKTAETYCGDLLILEGMSHNMMLEKKHHIVSEHIINWLKK